MLATLIASRAMNPTQAVIIVAFFTLLGPILGGTAVADTIGGIVNIQSLPKIDALIIVLCGVAGAIAWNLITWWLAIPSSSSHALVGGLTGVVVLSSGSQDVVWGIEALKHGHFEGVANVRTVGFGIYKLRALHGFNTQLTSAGVIFGASLFGGPVSTTHVVSTAIMGIGASEHPRAVHWAKAKEILLTWVLTLPCAAVLSCAIYSIVNYLMYILEV